MDFIRKILFYVYMRNEEVIEYACLGKGHHVICTVQRWEGQFFTAWKQLVLKTQSLVHLHLCIHPGSFFEWCAYAHPLMFFLIPLCPHLWTLVLLVFTRLLQSYFASLQFAFVLSVILTCLLSIPVSSLTFCIFLFLWQSLTYACSETCIDTLSLKYGLLQ